MKKRQRIIVMFLSLTMVFGLCSAERTVQTVKAQETEEIREEHIVQDMQKDSAEPQPKLGQEDVLKDTVKATKKADNPDGTMLENIKEGSKISVESKQPDAVATAQELVSLSVSNLSNPRIEKNPVMEARQNVTWDCILFGNYPQAEIVSSANDYTALDKSILNENANPPAMLGRIE